MNFEENQPPPVFKNNLEVIFSKYPNSKKDIETALGSLIKNPRVGDIIPGFAPMELRKLRLPLKKYNLSKSRGLRVIFLVDHGRKRITKLFIYSKSEYRGEKEVREKLDIALRELKGDQPLPFC